VHAYANPTAQNTPRNSTPITTRPLLVQRNPIN